ncbi:MAG: hypothetical protein M3188_02485, partial [Actinomycetota bacterium]|nr:hypothetical protein [Actinomycetota bacterium]
AGTERPDAAAHAVASALAAHPSVPLLAAAVGLAAATAPAARSRGLWGIAVWGSLFLAAALFGPALAGDAASAFLVVPGVWAGAAWLAVPLIRAERKRAA